MKLKEASKKAGKETLKELAGIDWKAMADANGDGKVTFKELINFIKGNWISIGWRLISSFATALAAIYYEVILEALK